MPTEDQESVIAIVWPTIGATGAGRLVGRLAGIEPGWDRFHVLGRLLAGLTIPISLGVFAWQLLPYVSRRYVLTSRRVVIRKGLSGVDDRSVGLDHFETIRIELLAGQEWLRSGDMVFLRGDREVFRLPGVPRPDVFRQTCLKARTALVSVREVLSRQAAETKK